MPCPIPMTDTSSGTRRFQLILSAEDHARFSAHCQALGIPLEQWAQDVLHRWYLEDMLKRPDA